MRCHTNNGSVSPSRSRCLGHTCGTNIDTEGVDFTEQRSNLVYLDKVFSFNEDTSNPILLNLNTGGANAANFITELTLRGRGCSIIPCTLGPNAVFTIDNTFVAVEYFNTRPPGSINATQVTLDGFNVDSVSYSNGQYTAKTANVLPRVQKDRCLDRGLPTKAFFMINNAGPWDLRAKYVLVGTVNTNGRICDFRLEISNAPNAPNTSLPSGSLSNFAIPNLSLPCSINGIAPDILFQFNAKINLVNPRLIVNCDPTLTPATAGITDNFQQCCPPCPPCPPVISPASCTVALATTLAIEPTVHVETIRRTLFCINACEGLQPCQGSLVAAEREDNEEECEIGGVDRPDCRCRNRVAGTSSRCCHEDDTDVAGAACGTWDVGGVTAGTGTCEDCNRRERDRDRDDVRGIRDCADILGEICEDLLGESTCIGGSGLAPNGTFGCDCDEVEGTSDRDRCHRRNHNNNDSNHNGNNSRVRTAFQFNGCNGCSW